MRNWQSAIATALLALIAVQAGHGQAPAATTPPTRDGVSPGEAKGAGVPVPVGPVIPVTSSAPAPAADVLPPATATAAPAKDPAAPAEAKPAAEAKPKGLVDSMHTDDNYGFKSLFDSLNLPDAKGKHWYEKLSLRGYTQFRYGRTAVSDHQGVDPRLLGDRSIDGDNEGFSIRRARFILFGDVSEHLYLYAQPDFGNTPVNGQPATFFGQLRDLYADVHIDKEKVHRFRVGLSKIPYGWENMQSSQNRLPLDRTDAINSGAAPNERDLGVFYYFTPEDKQRLLRDLVAGGLKGSGNYGIFGIGIYNGQGGSQLDLNEHFYGVARVTYPWELPSGQVVEASVQAYTGKHVVRGSRIFPGGGRRGLTPDGTDDRGILDQRLAGTFVWYPQPFGLQAEWNVGRGPGLSDDQTEVALRALHGGYLMAMYKWDTPDHGIITPYVRWQYFKGGYRSISNAPYGEHEQWDIGIEWQIRKEMELVIEYSLVDSINLNAVNESRRRSYRNYDVEIIRAQFQINY